MGKYLIIKIILGNGNPTHLNPVHLVKCSPVFFVILCLTEVPSEVIQDPEVVLGQAGLHEVKVEVAIPRYGHRHDSTFDCGTKN